MTEDGKYEAFVNKTVDGVKVEEKQIANLNKAESGNKRYISPLILLYN